MYFICIQTLFSKSPSYLNLFLSITINHLAFKDKRRVLYPPSDTRSSCWCLGWYFKDVSSATLPAAALSQWRLLLCCLSVSGGGAAGMKSVSLDPQVTPSCSSPTRELTPAEWKIKPLLIYDYTSSSLILRWICFGWFLDNEWEHRGHFVFFYDTPATRGHWQSTCKYFDKNHIESLFSCGSFKAKIQNSEHYPQQRDFRYDNA